MTYALSDTSTDLRVRIRRLGVLDEREAETLDAENDGGGSLTRAMPLPWRLAAPRPEQMRHPQRQRVVRARAVAAGYPMPEDDPGGSDA